MKSLFLSWCHTDRRAKEALIEPLMDNLKILDGVEISWWEDTDLQIGEDWRRSILGRLAECDYGLLLLSPAFFASTFIVTHELPPFVGTGAVKGALPVGLKRFPLDGSRNLQGVERHQIFTEPRSDKFFTETTGAGRERFATDLASAIRKRLLSDS